MPTSATPLLPLRVALSPVCVAVAATGADALFYIAEQALADSSFIELRLDELVDPASAVERVQQFCGQHPRAAVIATCRRVAGGGGFSGSAEEQLALLEVIAQAGIVTGAKPDGTAGAKTGVTLVDVELETLGAVSPQRLAQFGAAIARHGTRLLVSAHDFEKTADLDVTLARLRRLGAPAQPAVYKVVSTAQGLADNVRMLRFLERATPAVPLVGICMGEAGLASRVLALRSGALFTFASAGGSSRTAPGQVPAQRLLGEYRAASLGPATKIYGVAGNPIGHSLSPALHNAGFRSAGVDAVYLPLHTDSIDGLLELVRGVPLAGLSVTMPWKVEIVARLDAIDPLAAEIGAVNTVVVREDSSLFGTNTDVAAILEPLQRRLSLRDTPVLVLGAGGAARAAVFALRSAGARVSIWNRTAAKAEQLAQETGASVAKTHALGGFAAIVQATAAGMQASASAGKAQPALPLPLPLGADELAGVQVVFEMVYRPAETPLTRLARRVGIEVIEGLEMFTHQGLRQWELWAGQPAPVTAMSRALKSALAREAAVRPEMAGDEGERMAKNYDAVDRLMQLATDKPLGAPKRSSQEQTGQGQTGEQAGVVAAAAGSVAKPALAAADVPPDAIEVLAAQIVATEPQRHPAGVPEAVPHLTPGDRGRQLIGAIRPFLPVLGGALRMVDHGAVQAVARLLPLFEGSLTGGQRSPKPEPAAQEQHGASGLLEAIDKREAATAEALKEQGLRLTAAEDHVRRVRESVERMVAEEGAMSNRLREVTDRARLLTAAVIILLMLSIAEMVLLMILLHR